MKRKIINIDEKKCNGCGLCVKACHEGAIELVNGKARLVSDEYCDGLGDCLPECPTDAIKIIEREAKDYDDDAVKKRMEEMKNKNEEEKPMACGCPGTMAKMINRTSNNDKDSVNINNNQTNEIRSESQLKQWPVQLNLINTKSSFLENADLLIAADCTAYAYADFHKDFIKNHITIIGCPKLDNNEYYKEKLTEILRNNNIRSVKVVRMSVPCCTGIVNSVKRAMLESNVIVPYSEVIIDTDGRILKNI
ncbi:4Fe-4S dicluster domain-containing protein [Clostridium aestuarii]|uniref:4Fe-4S dicluster domain-containing protein n=1 Tax=Clostridium aestuarii TaxID=338193 RepID=A0ABT4D2W2_9CLOT|nr:4Fe-4S dicluster domain-containing protein [Clostridium aestuarii]MCY6485578.1 4Fe-4S dicluster domain-containing protein [Clostridium aestuarii]